MIKQTKKFISTVLITLLLVSFSVPAVAAQTSETGSVGLEGTVPTNPPSTAATISVPANGQVFTAVPITVSGLCPKDVLVKLFKNNIFTGAAQCINDSYSISTDLFTGRNDLVARVYDALDQAGPDSNKVSVTLSDNQQTSVPRVSVTSNYAKRGANPGEKLDWPLAISGGSGPYAININWGDGKAEDLISRPFAGLFSASHTYDGSGVYNILIKVTDVNGISTFLQLVGIANGPVSQAQAATKGGNNGSTTRTVTNVIWWPALIMIPLMLATFWLGKRYELHMLRRRLERKL